MDRTILRTVKEHNDNGIDIYQRKLVELLRRPKQTVNKHVRQLIDDGELAERYASVGRATYKYLYVPSENDRSDDGKLDEILMIVRILLSRSGKPGQ